MESPDKRLSEIVDIVRSWIPRRPEPPHVSRDFWMPDRSCRVCYDCDSQFTIFNRRHHCRTCGRVFCAKCTSNSIPLSVDDQRINREERERLRVCNYCYKQWEQEVASYDNGIRLSSPVLSPSPSATSLASSKSSSGNSSSSIGSTPYSTGPYQRVNYSSGLGFSMSAGSEQCSDKLPEMLTPRRDSSPAKEIRDPMPDHFGFCMNRSDEEEEEYAKNHSDSERRHFHQAGEYFAQDEFIDIDHEYAPFTHQNDQDHASRKVHPSDYIFSELQEEDPLGEDQTINVSSKENFNNKSSGSPRNIRANSQNPVALEKEEGEVHDTGDECDAASSIYGMETKDSEPVDFENNGLLWLPPEPEDKEDEREVGLFDDDDDEGNSGEWGYLRSSGSFGSGEYRHKDRSSEEHRKAMKNVVDGHFRALVAQLLQGESLPIGEEGDKESWLEIITSLSWEAATLLKPDTSKGGGMDPGGYVKVKCIACGLQSESMVVKGVVCKKNVAHRRMTARFEKPRFLLLGGALEYHRVSNQLSSVDTLLQQEMDYLKMAVAKIDAHQPNVLLVEKSVSRFAQEYLLAKDISLVLNIKKPLQERIARCTGAQIVPSIDHLSSQKLGHCEVFHVDKFIEEHGSAGQAGKKLLKTLMFFEGCPKPLGCTVLLKGANGDELKKIKHVVQYGIFAAYHLALETSFLADEGASLPELPLKSPITVALPDKPTNVDRSISTVPGFMLPGPGTPQSDHETRRSPCIDQSSKFSPYPKNGFDASFNGPIHNFNNHSYSNMPQKHFPTENFQTQHLSQPVPKSRFSSSSVSGQLVSCMNDNLSHYDPYGEKANLDFEEPSDHESLPSTNHPVLSNGHKDFEALDGSIRSNEMQLEGNKMGSLHQRNSFPNEHGSSKEEFPPSPSDHQSILVSLSTRCVWKGTVCERAHLFRIKYYGSFDKPVGRFLRDDLFDQDYRCPSCDAPTEAHVHCYTHRQGSLTISVKKLPEFPLPGEKEGKIWMWHRCLKCPRTNGFPPATRRVVMSDAAWGLSFGKFLELSFSNHAAASRVASCGHSLHRDCLRFYGFGRMVACFRYASIDVHNVYLPPSKLDFDYQHQEWIKKEAAEVTDRAELFFAEVFDSLRQIGEKTTSSRPLYSNAKAPESRRRIAELEGMLQKEKAEFEESLQKAISKEFNKGQPVIDILELNRLRRQLLFQSYVWDHRLLFLDLSLKNMAATSSDHKTREELNNPTKPKATTNSIETVSIHTSEPKQNDNLTGSESPRLGIKSDEALKGGWHSEEDILGLGDDPKHIEDHQENNLNPDKIHQKESQFCLTNSLNITDELNFPEAGIGVRRVLSEGHFPILANLSDTLDAAWTGEGHPQQSLASIESGPVAKDPALVDTPVTILEPSVVKAKPEEVAQPIVHVKGNDHGEDFASWFGAPFLNFYRAYSKSSSGGAPRYDALGDYNPTYVSSFRELEHQGGARLLLPVGINDTVVPVYDEEPTSMIAFALVSQDYHSQISEDRERGKEIGDYSIPSSLSDVSSHPFQSSIDDSVSSDSLRSFGSLDDGVSIISGSRNSLSLDPLIFTKALHVRVSFTDEGPLGKVKYSVTCYYAKRFDALRRKCCPTELDFIRSLSRCKKWGAQGGKSNVFFAKTLDDRFIIKQVTKTELESFIKFAPEYFKYLSESLSTGSPTCLAKILGIYQVTTKHLKGGKESRMDLMVMENLLFRRNVTRLYDLKGSSRSRYNPDSSGSNKVLLDQNLIEAMPTSPIFVGNKAKRLLERAVWNDTAFLASIDVMDYSLLVGVDQEKHELVLGIIDFMRQYTWDKHLETWVKASGILGGPKNESPTVISPKQYKKRFRKAMSAYFLMVPDQWSPPTIIPSASHSDLCEDGPPSLSLE
ncbi:hypothetical protein AMTRI_Chr13g117270 [Amborella trichopoda]